MNGEIVRPLTGADGEAALALWQARFFDSDSFCRWYFSERYTPALSAGVFLDGELVSMALGRPVTLWEDGAEMAAVMVAGVSTRSGYERRGYMRRAMAHVEHIAGQAKASRLVLRPVDPAIYLPLGFLPYSAASIAFGTGNRPARLCRPAAVDPSALAAFQARTGEDMAARLRDAASDGGACVLLADGAAVCAYALLESPEGDAVEAVGRTAEAYAALLDALPSGCSAMQAPNAPLGARIPHLMAKTVCDAPAFDPHGAAGRFVPEEY